MTRYAPADSPRPAASGDKIRKEPRRTSGVVIRADEVDRRRAWTRIGRKDRKRVSVLIA